MPTVALLSEVVLMASATRGWRVKVCVADDRIGVTPFVAETVMVREVKAFVAVPLSTPADESVRPGGNVPEVTANDGAGWPRATNVCE